VHGPVWNNPNVGVTGEKNFSNTEPNFVTITDSAGGTKTLVGSDADTYRRLTSPA
jgi:hypothetical protein